MIFADINDNTSSVSKLRKIRKEILSLADVENIDYNGFRHLHATVSLETGEAIEKVSERLGHSSINVTLKFYKDVIKGSQRKDNIERNRKLKLA